MEKTFPFLGSPLSPPAAISPKPFGCSKTAPSPRIYFFLGVVVAVVAVVVVVGGCSYLVLFRFCSEFFFKEEEKP